MVKYKYLFIKKKKKIKGRVHHPASMDVGREIGREIVSVRELLEINLKNKNNALFKLKVQKISRLKKFFELLKKKKTVDEVSVDKAHLLDHE